MKTKKLGLLVVTAIMLGALLYSCSKDENNPVSKEVQQGTLKGGNSSFYWPDVVCAGYATDFCLSIPPVFNKQNKALTQEYAIQLWDEGIGDYLTLMQGTTTESVTVTKCVQHTFNDAGEYLVRYKIGSGGFSDNFTVTVQNCDCDESFSYVDNGNETYTFTYVPSDNMTDAQVVFTFAQSDRVEVTGDVSIANGWSSNGQTYQKTMNFVKCVPVSWTVGLAPKCSGHSGQSNLWTDFKIGEVSKKNDNTPNITYNCPKN